MSPLLKSPFGENEAKYAATQETGTPAHRDASPLLYRVAPGTRALVGASRMSERATTVLTHLIGTHLGHIWRAETRANCTSRAVVI